MEMPPDDLHSAGYLTNLCGRLLVRALERRLPGGAAGPMPVFLALLGGDALPQKELARLAAVEQPTMAKTLKRMERDGLVAGTRDPADRRSTLLHLTPRGHAQAQIAIAAAGEVNALALSALTPEERAPFLDALERIITRLESDTA